MEEPEEESLDIDIGGGSSEGGSDGDAESAVTGNDEDDAEEGPAGGANNASDWDGLPDE